MEDHQAHLDLQDRQATKRCQEHPVAMVLLDHPVGLHAIILDGVALIRYIFR